MAVMIRMVRMGRRNRAFFRVRASDRRAAAGGRFLEELGYVDPIEKDPAKAVSLKKDRIEYWLSRGAQPSATVRSLLKKQGIGASAKA
jgi:small subunit ribosomal protein S16